jgi:hypothetical protein
MAESLSQQEQDAMTRRLLREEQQRKACQREIN